MIDDVDDSTEVSEKVTKVLKRMRNQYQEILMLKYIDNKKVAAIATELGKSIKAVESDLFRARKEFKALWAISRVFEEQ